MNNGLYTTEVYFLFHEVQNLFELFSGQQFRDVFYAMCGSSIFNKRLPRSRIHLHQAGGRERGCEGLQGECFYRPGPFRLIGQNSHSLGQNSDIWPHLTSRRGLVSCSGRRGADFGELVSLYHQTIMIKTHTYKAFSLCQALC